MMDYRIGDVRDVMASIPDGSVDLIASSPPFLALRSYLPAGHASKGAEIGSEANPAAFLDTLLSLTAEWGRVLAPHGSIAVELGDTYSGSGAGLTSSDAKRGTTEQAARVDATKGVDGWPLPKSLALIPQLYQIALAYGINPLTGQPSPAGRFRVRNVIVWHRPNPAVGALGDKFRPSTSYITVATRSKDRWFDLTAVRTAHKDPTDDRHLRPTPSVLLNSGRHETSVFMTAPVNAAGAPPLDTWFDHHDTWTLTTQPSSLAHYAMWPAKLAERLILSMCPEWVCSVCGEARRRVESETQTRYSFGYHQANNGGTTTGGMGRHTISRNAPTLGWTDCGHDNYRPGVVLDPFAGTGTTLCVADLHGRYSIGIDINPTNRDLLEPRMAEVRRALFGTQPEIPGQGDLFAEVPAC